MSTIEQLTAERDALKAQMEAKQVGDAFAASQFVRERLTAPAAMVESTFRKHFAVENGRVVARDATGNTLMSRERLGEPADFEEAIDFFVSRCGFADQIMRGSGASGSGATQSAPRGSKSLSRAAFGALPPLSRWRTSRTAAPSRTERPTTPKGPP